MGRYYNKGWSVADTNRLAFLIREKFPHWKLDKDSLMNFVVRVKKAKAITLSINGFTEEDILFIYTLPTGDPK
jgi:hypothetical protein